MHKRSVFQIICMKLHLPLKKRNIQTLQILALETTIGPAYLESACLNFTHLSNQNLHTKYFPLTAMLNVLLSQIL